MNIGNLGVAAIAALTVAASSHAIEERLVGIGFLGNYIEINPNTANSNFITDVGNGIFNASTSLPGGGFLVAHRISSAFSFNLVRLDTLTGSITSVTFLHDDIDIRGLAALPNRVVYATVFSPGSVGFDLYRINASTGATTNLGPIRAGLSPVFSQALASDADGNLFGWNQSRGLTMIDPATGDAQFIGNGPGDGTRLQAMAFNSAGRLFGSMSSNVGSVFPRNSLFEISLDDGSLDFIGVYASSISDPANDLRGLDFIPSPGTVSLLGLSALGFVRRRR